MIKTIFNQKHPNQNRSTRRRLHPVRLKGNDQGMTMVEVLMGFVLLLLMLGMLSGIIVLSSRMFERSVDLRRAQESLQQSVYKTYVTGSPVSEGALSLVRVTETPEESVTIPLKTTKLYKLTTSNVLEGVEKESLNMYFYFFK